MRTGTPCEEDWRRGFATGKQTPSQLREELAKENVKELSNQQKAKKNARALDRVSALY